MDFTVVIVEAGRTINLHYWDFQLPNENYKYTHSAWHVCMVTVEAWINNDNWWYKDILHRLECNGVQGSRPTDCWSGRFRRIIYLVAFHGNQPSWKLACWFTYIFYKWSCCRSIWWGIRWGNWGDWKYFCTLYRKLSPKRCMSCSRWLENLRSLILSTILFSLTPMMTKLMMKAQRNLEVIKI